MSRPGSPSTLAHSTHRQYDSGENTPSYPLLPSHRDRMWSEDKNPKREDSLDREPKRQDYGSYPNSEPGHGYPGMHQRAETGDTLRPENRRSGSWDILGGIRRLEHSYVEFDPRRASQAHLVYAEGDMPKNAVSTLSLICTRCSATSEGGTTVSSDIDPLRLACGGFVPRDVAYLTREHQSVPV